MEERIRYLFNCYVENKCSHAELEEFFQFIRRAEHDEQLRQLIRQVYTELGDSIPQTTFVDESGQLVLRDPEWIASEQRSKKRSRKAFSTALGTSIVVVLIAAVLIISKSRSKESTNTSSVASLTRKSTDRSESKYIVLADSTKVWLNAASSIQFPDQFNSDRREVYLEGEAYFDVKHADKIPFVIHTSGISTTVLGTAFNIKAYPGQKNVTVSVSRGKVRVSRTDGYEVTLTQGQQVKIEESTKDAIEKKVPIEEVAAWQQGYIMFDDESIEDIVGDLQRLYNADIRIADPSLAGLKISTSFKKEIGVEQALQVLCKLTDTKLTKKETVYFVE